MTMTDAQRWLERREVQDAGILLLHPTLVYSLRMYRVNHLSLTSNWGDVT